GVGSPVAVASQVVAAVTVDSAAATAGLVAGSSSRVTCHLPFASRLAERCS
ncbi:hypothetical protein NJB14194_11820, partial [Mycobacterium montefiorense]